MSLVWKGLELQPSHERWRFWIAQGRDEQHSVRRTRDLIPFRSGRLLMPGIPDSRRIELRGLIDESSASALAASRDDLKALLDPAADEGLLVDTLEDGSVRWIPAVPVNVIWQHGTPSIRLVSVELEAVSDPLWHSSWGTLALDSGLTLDSGWTLDSSAPIVIAGSAVVDTLGNADVERVRVQFTGPSTGPVGLITGGAAPVGFEVARTLVAGEVLEVDNEARTVLLNGVSVRNLMTLRTANQHGEYLRLPPGPVTLWATGGATETRLLFDPAYL